MAESNPSRREFLRNSTAALSGALALPYAAQSAPQGQAAGKQFKQRQQARRQELWQLLGDLPWQHRPKDPQVVSTEKHEGYTLQRLVLDLNGEEPVPALLLIPDKRPPRAPGLLFIHWHAGMYDLGKEQLLRGTDV